MDQQHPLYFLYTFFVHGVSAGFLTFNWAWLFVLLDLFAGRQMTFGNPPLIWFFWALFSPIFFVFFFSPFSSFPFFFFFFVLPLGVLKAYLFAFFLLFFFSFCCNIGLPISLMFFFLFLSFLFYCNIGLPSATYTSFSLLSLFLFHLC